MNGTLKSLRKNSNQRKSKRKITDGEECTEGNTELEGVVDLPEPLKFSKKISLEKQRPDEDIKYIAVCMEDPLEEPDDEHVENTESQIRPKDEGFHNCVIGIEKTEKYEEVRTTNITNEIVHVEENIPSFRDQIVSVSNRIKKQESRDNVLPSKTNGLTANAGGETEKSGFANIENRTNDLDYMTAQTLRVGTVREEDKIELRRLERTDAFYNRNTDVYKNNYSSSESVQETDELFSDTAIDTILDDLKNISKDTPNKANKENGQIMVHESEYGFKYEEKHYVSKLEKQRVDSLRYKPLSLESNTTEQGAPRYKQVPSESTTTEQGPPVITIQPSLQRTRSGRVFKTLPMAQIIDEIDSKICFKSEKIQEDRDNDSEPLSAKYKSNCVLDCFCCLVESFI